MSPSISVLSHLGAEATAAWLGRALLFGTLLALLTALITRLGRRRLSPALQAALWALVLIKFLMPVGPSWSLSLPSLCEAALRLGPRLAVGLDVAEKDPTESVLLATEAGSGPAVPRREGVGWPLPIILIYLLGAAGLLGLRLQRYRRFRALCLALPAADPTTTHLVEGVCRRLGVRRQPQIRITEELPAPFIMGVFRPLLVLSRRQLERPTELETVVVHEITHIRRGDLVLRCLQWIAGGLFFFWPVVAWVNRRIDAAREHACDQWALRHGKLTPGEYARCLLRAVPVRPRRMMYRPAYMAGRITNIERRIDMILETTSQPARRPLWGLVALLLVAVWGGFALSGAAEAGDRSSEHAKLSEKAIWKHAEAIVARIGEYDSADVDGDGKISFDERNAFLMALFYSNPSEAIELFPYAKHLRDREKLQGTEIYDVIRGLTYRKKAITPYKQKYMQLKEEGAGDKQLKKLKNTTSLVDLESTEVVLKSQDALLDALGKEQDPEFVAMLLKKIEYHQQKDSLKDLQKKRDMLKKKIAVLQEEGEHEKAEELLLHLRKLEEKLKQIRDD